MPPPTVVTPIPDQNNKVGDTVSFDIRSNFSSPPTAYRLNFKPTNTPQSNATMPTWAGTVNQTIVFDIAMNEAVTVSRYIMTGSAATFPLRIYVTNAQKIRVDYRDAALATQSCIHASAMALNTKYTVTITPTATNVSISIVTLGVTKTTAVAPDMTGWTLDRIGSPTLTAPMILANVTLNSTGDNRLYKIDDNSTTTLVNTNSAATNATISAGSVVTGDWVLV